MVVEPVAISVTAPVVELTVAISVLLLLQVTAGVLIVVSPLVTVAAIVPAFTFVEPARSVVSAVASMVTVGVTLALGSRIVMLISSTARIAPLLPYDRRT